MLIAPFQGGVEFSDFIQGLRAKPLTPGYLLPRLRRCLSCLASRSTERDGVCAIHFTNVNPSVVPVVNPRMFPPQTLVESRMTPVVLITEAIVEAIMSSLKLIVEAIAATRTIIPFASRPFAIPASVARIMAINKLATLTVALAVVATLPLVALISESGPR